ncbi:hypothetical protein PF001_g24829 [Phytophthora fragariae]|uniref:Uncharacterized protein n=1 Tax=Phytophthora fragariae TaxID=53985 RepID=A0A6A4BTQ5_9STRA|nr:hypothetical protein PF001_g24829 [Phytophthora fragariae]
MVNSSDAHNTGTCKLKALCSLIFSGVKEEDRCPNWKTGKHYLPGQEPQGWCTVQ